MSAHQSTPPLPSAETTSPVASTQLPSQASTETPEQSKPEIASTAPPVELKFDTDAVTVYDKDISPLEGWVPVWKMSQALTTAELKAAPSQFRVIGDLTSIAPNGNKLYRAEYYKVIFELINVVSFTTGRRYTVARRVTPPSVGLPEQLPPVYSKLEGTLPPPRKTWW